jgi:hypothetical protein
MFLEITIALMATSAPLDQGEQPNLSARLTNTALTV